MKPVPQLSNKQFDRDAKWQTMRDSCFTTGWGVFDEGTPNDMNTMKHLIYVASKFGDSKKMAYWRSLIWRFINLKIPIAFFYSRRGYAERQ